MSANQTSLPTPEVPRSPLDRVGRFTDFRLYLINTAEKIESINSDAEMDRLRLIVKMRKFYSGHQVGYVSKVDNRWVDKKKRGDALYVDPILASFIDINVAQIVKSRPTIKVTAKSVDRVDKEQSALYAQELLEDAQQALFTADFLQKEAKLGLQLSGEAYRITSFDPHVKGTEIRIPITKKKMVEPTAAAWDCPACNSQGPLDEEAKRQFNEGSFKCPNCQYWKVDQVKGEPFETSVVTGYEDRPAGDVRCESPDPLEMKVVGGEEGIGEALAVTRDRLIMRGILEAEYPKVKIPSTGTVPLKLQYVQNLKLDAPQAGLRGDDDTVPSKGGEQFELLHFKEVWLDVMAYGGYVFEKDTRLPELSKPKSERTLVKAGTKFEDVTNERGSFKYGCYYLKVGNEILDIFPNDKRNNLTHCVNNIGEGFHGLGEWDLLPLQEQKNVLRSLMFAKEKFDAFSPTLVRTPWVDPQKLAQARSVPNALVPVANMPDDRPLSYAVERVQPGQSVSGAYELDGIIGNSMQYRTGASSLETGAPDMIGKNKTATAVNAAQMMSEGRRGPMLQLRAEMERQQAYQILQLRKDNWPEQMYETLDKKVGGDAGAWFRKSDIRRDFKIEIVPESWWPQTAEQRKEDLAALFAVADPMNPQVRKALWNRATELHGRGLDLNSYQSDKIEARIRLERLRQVAETLEGASKNPETPLPIYDPQGSPVMTMVNVAIEKARLIPELPAVDKDGEVLSCNYLLDRHEEYIDAYTSWLLTSEGRAASPFVRAVINRVIVKHYDGRVEQAQFQQMQEMAVQAPQQQAQQEAMAAQQQETEAQLAEAEDQGAADQIEQAIGEQAMKEKDREHAAQVDVEAHAQKAIVDTAAKHLAPTSQAKT